MKYDVSSILEDAKVWAADLTTSNWDEVTVEDGLSWVYSGIVAYQVVPVEAYLQHLLDKYDITEELSDINEYCDTAPCTHLMIVAMSIHDVRDGSTSYAGYKIPVYTKDDTLQYCESGGIDECVGGGPEYQDSPLDEINTWLSGYASISEMSQLASE